MDSKNVKIAIVGSRDFEDEQLIKTTIKSAVQKFGKNNVTIVSGGQSDGADGYAKKYATSTKYVNYVEFPPAHYEWNKHCLLDESEYGKEFDVSHYHRRNQQIVDYSDMLIAFLPKGMPLRESRGTSSVVKKANESKIKVKVVN